MSSPYAAFKTLETPQSEPIIGSNQVANNAGGYVWTVDDWVRLHRFLLLGSDGSTYYCTERKMTLDNAQCVVRCIQADGLRTVREIVDVSDAGRAPKNDPALFALALCASLGNPETRQAALAALPTVARIGTHLFHFLEYCKGNRGWGRGLRKAIARWYQDKPVLDLAYQAVKYQQRDGWSHRDVLRLSHPKPITAAEHALYKWITHGEIEEEAVSYLPLVWAHEKAKDSSLSSSDIAKLIIDYNLPRESIPTERLNDPAIWDALLQKMPLTAMVRNLRKMTGIGLMKPMSHAASLVADRLGQRDYIRKSRLHPLALLVALKVYQQGHGDKGKLSWSPVQSIVDALDEAFYLAFDNVEPTGKRLLLGVDVSGSMSDGTVAGMPISPREAAAAMALVTARTEKNHVIMGFSEKFVDIPISPRQRLDDVLRTMQAMPYGGTDCSLPMAYAHVKKLSVDAFIVYTDNETWYGKIHPAQMLDAYRRESGIPSKLIVAAFTATEFSIADPNDASMLDIVGFDTAAPAVISDFINA